MDNPEAATEYPDPNALHYFVGRIHGDLLRTGLITMANWTDALAGAAEYAERVAGGQAAQGSGPDRDDEGENLF